MRGEEDVGDQEGREEREVQGEDGYRRKGGMSGQGRRREREREREGGRDGRAKGRRDARRQRREVR